MTTGSEAIRAPNSEKFPDFFRRILPGSESREDSSD
jgi:hypothetical protein